MRAILLLRAVNLGPRNRIAMPALRELLTAAGFVDVRTHVQSGNIVLTSDAAPGALAKKVGRLIDKEFGFEPAIVMRTRDELAEVVARNPLARVAKDPKRYQVSFLEHELDAGVVEELEQLAVKGERLVALGRELYAWHPHGVARSRLWTGIASPRLPVVSTARNWSTTTSVLALADEID